MSQLCIFHANETPPAGLLGGDARRYVSHRLGAMSPQEALSEVLKGICVQWDLGGVVVN